MSKRFKYGYAGMFLAMFLFGGCYNQPGLVADNSYNRTKQAQLLER